VNRSTFRLSIEPELAQKERSVLSSTEGSAMMERMPGAAAKLRSSIQATLVDEVDCGLVYCVGVGYGQSSLEPDPIADLDSEPCP
jgi:hypothetical protein